MSFIEVLKKAYRASTTLEGFISKMSGAYGGQIYVKTACNEYWAEQKNNENGLTKEITFTVENSTLKHILIAAILYQNELKVGDLLDNHDASWANFEIAHKINSHIEIVTFHFTDEKCKELYPGLDGGRITSDTIALGISRMLEKGFIVDLNFISAWNNGDADRCLQEGLFNGVPFA